MSIDFDSAALQTQQDEDEYDQEDYAREQEVQKWVLSLLVNIEPVRWFEYWMLCTSNIVMFHRSVIGFCFAQLFTIVVKYLMGFILVSKQTV